jgi:hypothetical protein
MIALSNIYAKFEMLTNEHLFSLQLLMNY